MYIAAYPEDDPNAATKYQACEQEYFSMIGSVWADQIAQSEREMQDARNVVAACLRANGIDVPSTPSTQELAPITSPRRREPAVAACLRQGADVIGMPAFIA